MTMTMPSAPKVLLVQDDPQFVYLIQRYCRSSGCQVIRVDEVNQTVTLAQQELPNLILLDLAPDRAERWQLLQALRSDPATCKIPVFICSASEVAMQGWEEYADGCLLMPVMYEDFCSVLAASISFPTSDAASEPVSGA